MRMLSNFKYPYIGNPIPVSDDYLLIAVNIVYFYYSTNCLYFFPNTNCQDTHIPYTLNVNMLFLTTFMPYLRVICLNIIIVSDYKGFFFILVVFNLSFSRQNFPFEINFIVFFVRCRHLASDHQKNLSR